MLASFAESVGTGTIADIGCGPARVTAHLDSLGLAAFGIDLSPVMVAIARRTHPSLRFEDGLLLLAFQVGDEPRHLSHAYGHDITLDAYCLPPDRVGEMMRAAGLDVIAQLMREPDGSERTPQAFMIGRRRGRG